MSKLLNQDLTDINCYFLPTTTQSLSSKSMYADRWYWGTPHTFGNRLRGITGNFSATRVQNTE